ncbi:MAG: hypothetical protein ACKOB6_01940, partial [Candidatus Kapaibacterium sp.]
MVFRSSSLATATVSVTSVTGKPLERVARIVDTRRAATVSFARKDIELRGEAADSSMSGASQVECAIRTQVVRITADSAVTAVVIGGGSRSSYAKDLLPMNLAGRSYVVASMPSTVVEDDSVRGTTDSMKSGHSQCVIIAREDSTTVRVQIRGVTTRNSRGEKSIVLQAGEAFLMQAALDTLAANGDLSGTQIIADKPVVVISGHSNAAFPAQPSRVSSQVQRGSAAQQLLAVDRWTRTYMVIPVSMTEAGAQTNREWVRVYSAVPETLVSFSGEAPIAVAAGVFLGTD